MHSFVKSCFCAAVGMLCAGTVFGQTYSAPNRQPAGSQRMARQDYWHGDVQQAWRETQAAHRPLLIYQSVEKRLRDVLQPRQGRS